MIYHSDAITVQRLPDDIAELHFDLQGESVNKFDQRTVQSLQEALEVEAVAQSKPGTEASGGNTKKPGQDGAA